MALAGAPHANGAQVQIGGPSDFPDRPRAFSPAIHWFASSITQGRPCFSLPVFLNGAADALTGAPGVFLVKTAGVDAIHDSNANGGRWRAMVIEVWSDTANAHTVTTCSFGLCCGGPSTEDRNYFFQHSKVRGGKTLCSQPHFGKYHRPRAELSRLVR